MNKAVGVVASIIGWFVVMTPVINLLLQSSFEKHRSKIEYADILVGPADLGGTGVVKH